VVLSRDRISSVDKKAGRIQRAEESIRKWRVIQLGASLPLMLCVMLMLYFREVSVYGIVAFFLILVIGVLFPEMKSDVAQIRVIIAEENSMLRLKLQQLSREELQRLLQETATQDLMKNSLSSP
jgi:hypothetical protein